MGQHIAIGSNNVFIQGTPPPSDEEVEKFARDLRAATERAARDAAAEGKEISLDPPNSFSLDRNFQQFGGNFNNSEHLSANLQRWVLSQPVGSVSQQDLIYQAIIQNDYNVPNGIGAVATALHHSRNGTFYARFADLGVTQPSAGEAFEVLNKQYYRYAFSFFSFSSLIPRAFNLFKGFQLDIHGWAKLSNEKNSAAETARKDKESMVGGKGTRLFLGRYSAARDGDKTACGLTAVATQSVVMVNGKPAHIEGDPVPCLKSGCTHQHVLHDSRATHVFIGGTLIYLAHE
jgi:uncharacterized Zn-binding protein involved in type VI secretion